MTASLFHLESLAYQNDAVDAVVRVFDGTPKAPAHERVGNRSPLSWAQFQKNICDIAIVRVKRVIQGFDNYPQPIDAGFKVFTLEKSAFPRADFAPDPDASAELNPQALKAFVAQKETNLFSQPDAQAIVCFDSHLDTATLDWLGQLKVNASSC